MCERSVPKEPYDTPRSICIPVSFGLCPRLRVLDTVGTRTDTQAGLVDDAAGYRQIHAGQGASTPIPARLGERALFEGDSDRPIDEEKRLGPTRRRCAGLGAIEHRDG